MYFAKLATVATLLLALAATGSLAKPYYYFFQEPVVQAQPPASASPVAQTNQQPPYDSSSQQSTAGNQQDTVDKIGKDISNAFHQARERIEPSLQSAGETVVPLVKQVQEKGGEALNKVRGFFDKITSGGSTSGGAVEQQVQAASTSIQEAGQSVQQAAHGAIQGAVAQ